MNDPMLHAELAQARRAVAEMASRCELYGRLCALLSNAIRNGTAVENVEGHVAFKKSQVVACGKAFAATVEQGKVTDPSNPDPNAEPIDMVVLVVKAKGETNGLVVPKSVLVAPGGN